MVPNLLILLCLTTLQTGKLRLRAEAVFTNAAHLVNGVRIRAQNFLMPHSQVPLHVVGSLECFHSLLCLGPFSDWCHQVLSPMAAKEPQTDQCPPWRKKDCYSSHRQHTAFRMLPLPMCALPLEKDPKAPGRERGWGRGKDEGSTGLTKAQGRPSTAPLIPRPCSQGGHPPSRTSLCARHCTGH